MLQDWLKTEKEAKVNDNKLIYTHIHTKTGKQRDASWKTWSTAPTPPNFTELQDEGVERLQRLGCAVRKVGKLDEKYIFVPRSEPHEWPALYAMPGSPLVRTEDGGVRVDLQRVAVRGLDANSPQVLALQALIDGGNHEKGEFMLAGEKRRFPAPARNAMDWTFHIVEEVLEGGGGVEEHIVFLLTDADGVVINTEAPVYVDAFAQAKIDPHDLRGELYGFNFTSAVAFAHAYTELCTVKYNPISLGEDGYCPCPAKMVATTKTHIPHTHLREWLYFEKVNHPAEGKWMSTVCGAPLLTAGLLRAATKLHPQKGEWPFAIDINGTIYLDKNFSSIPLHWFATPEELELLKEGCEDLRQHPLFAGVVQHKDHRTREQVFVEAEAARVKIEMAKAATAKKAEGTQQ
jgi:hypothetical protein